MLIAMRINKVAGLLSDIKYGNNIKIEVVNKVPS